MATATIEVQGKIRAVNAIRDGNDNGSFRMDVLKMNTINPYSSTPDREMQRSITWGSHAQYARSTNKLPVKTELGGFDEYEGALLFPIAAGRRFSNMTLHFSESQFPLALTFILEGAEEITMDDGGAKLIGLITINF